MNSLKIKIVKNINECKISKFYFIDCYWDSTYQISLEYVTSFLKNTNLF